MFSDVFTEGSCTVDPGTSTVNVLWSNGPGATAAYTGVGVYTITLGGGGIDVNEGIFDVEIVGLPPNLPRPITMYVGHTSDTEKEIRAVEEGATGGASAAVDVAQFTFTFRKRRPV